MRCAISVAYVPNSAAASLILTEEDVERQFAQFVIFARRSAKHDERPSCEDMVQEAWALHYYGAGTGHGSRVGLGATCVERQGRIATSLFARSPKTRQDPASRRRARQSAYKCVRGSQQHHFPSRFGGFLCLALTALCTPPVCHRFCSRPLAVTRGGRGASRAYAPGYRRRHARLHHHIANHAGAQSAQSRSIALGLSPCAGPQLHPPRPLAPYSVLAFFFF